MCPSTYPIDDIMVHVYIVQVIEERKIVNDKLKIWRQVVRIMILDWIIFQLQPSI
jgi:hypothetical protein